jgi:hypothetical protein
MGHLIGGWVDMFGWYGWWLLYGKHVPGLCISNANGKCNNINIMYSLGMAQFFFFTLCVVKCMCLGLGYIEN